MGESIDVPGLVRRVRRIADLSQRELAARIEVSRYTVGRLESGTTTPGLRLLERILAVGHLHLEAVDAEGREVLGMHVWDDRRDGGDRRYPAHLDIVLDPKMGEWWGDVYGLARPPETYHRDRGMRDYQRRRSQWEVRVAAFRHAPPPEPPRRPPHDVPMPPGWVPEYENGGSGSG